ncbi:DUF2252 domain-containing protein [Undibacterium sp. 5I1]|uniref:DUF2252 domain-containing protein n=1 Tax=unclassified Undibacterium TaxID=2630295 RepID=UPI002AB4A595|nr:MULTISPECIES: DUF2252 domain-containing protein [unclassified Undibacterium]MDY7539072.1 DUF2252 domain-containing protein [Undibacterium sp. 5I1]MEB0229794.1 DUF2252 domain-containing protein [Undibacterium sp. 10I3]MEB0258301.1 DUF2252 domain-containing protein [Undibacterium sp. 5I1]
MQNVVDHILNFNAGRDSERLTMKYRNMRQDAFVFLRGTCHLFYARLPKHKLLQQAPLAWCCGDLHLENFGSYKGDNRLAYFDINDFDEAALAPLSWDLIRVLASILVAAPTLGLTGTNANALCKIFLESYSCALGNGKSYWIERDNTTGMVHQLLDSLKHRQRVDFLNKRSVVVGKKRQLIIDGVHALALTPKQRKRITEWMAAFAEKQADKKFFKVIDVAKRIAGTGSLGVDRYILLVQGKGNPDNNYLLDLKQSLPSSLVPYLGNFSKLQPAWKSEADRTVTLQRRMQAVSMAFLQPVHVGKQSYILRALLPTEDRVALAKAKTSTQELQDVIKIMAGLLASAHLRSSSRQGSAIADELIAFGQQKKWGKQMLTLAQGAAAQVNQDWQTYCKAYDAGDFEC